MKTVFDTNILIEYFEGADLDFFERVEELLKTRQSLVSRLVFIELFSSPDTKKRQEKRIRKFFSEYFTIVEIDEKIAEKTIALRKKYKLKTVDAIIAATAKVNDAKLLTRDKELLKKLDKLCVSF